MSNVSFKGKSNLFISGDMYNSFFDRSANSRRVITKVFSDNTLSKHKPFVALPDATDLVVIVRNEHDGFMKKFPTIARIEEIAEDIYRKIEILKKNSEEKLTAWIFGGSSYTVDNGKTIKAVNEIGEVLCDRPDIDTSILAGPKLKSTPIGINGKVGETDIIIPKSKNTIIENAEELENYFDIVELNNVETKIS